MMVPVYALFVSLRMLDSLIGTVLFLAATALPMAIWMTKNFMDSVPISLEEAAWVDGASSMRALWSIVIPLMRSGIAVVFIFVFTAAWGLFVPFVLLSSAENQPAAVAIYGFFGAYGTVAYGKARGLLPPVLGAGARAVPRDPAHYRQGVRHGRRRQGLTAPPRPSHLERTPAPHA